MQLVFCGGHKIIMSGQATMHWHPGGSGVGAGLISKTPLGFVQTHRVCGHEFSSVHSGHAGVVVCLLHFV